MAQEYSVVEPWIGRNHLNNSYDTQKKKVQIKLQAKKELFAKALLEECSFILTRRICLLMNGHTIHTIYSHKNYMNVFSNVFLILQALAYHLVWWISSFRIHNIFTWEVVSLAVILKVLGVEELVGRSLTEADQGEIYNRK